MLRLILSGCHGRMGHQVIAACSGRADVAIVAGIDHAGRPAEHFPVFPKAELCQVPADVLVDFSRPDALEALLALCVQRQLPVVLAVTGYSQRQRDLIVLAARTIPVFQAANLSIGANILLRLAKQAAEALGPDFGAAITERHHREKLDSPSGTALLLSQSLPQTPELFSIRAGTTAGEHTVMFAGPDEVLELSHRADSREVYAAGAVRAAHFISSVNCPGLYGMEALLKSHQIF